MEPKDAFAEFKKHSLAKEGAVEEYPWDDVAWKVKGKMFACTSKDSSRVSVKSTLEKQEALIMHPQIEKSHYVGRFGWVTIDVNDQETLDLALELIDESYDLISKKKKK